MHSIGPAGRPSANSPLADFAAILVRPRRTMRHILDHQPDRTVIPLVLLATLSALVGDLRIADLQRIPQGTFSTATILLIVAAVVLVALCSVLFFYFLAWIAVPIGRFLDGEGRTREVRSALAWGLAPLIAALIYRVPAMFLGPSASIEPPTRVRLGDDTLLFGFDGLTGADWGSALAFAVLEIGTLLWLMFVASSTLAEAHRFSRTRGLGTLMLGLASPLVVLVSAILAFRP